MFRALLTRYEQLLSRAPTATTGVVAAGLGFLGDAFAQRAENSKSMSVKELTFDFRRSSAFTLYSGCWGTFGLRPWLNLLNSTFPGRTLQAIGKKSILQMAFWNPFIYLPTFYCFNGLYRGQDAEAAIAKFCDEYVNCVLYIWKVWAPISISIFIFVPMRHQVGVNFLGNLLWNFLISLFYNQHRIQQHVE
eukprot:symbB.v1.2.033957.t1/scaffold4297.1/size41748/3